MLVKIKIVAVMICCILLFSCCTLSSNSIAPATKPLPKNASIPTSSHSALTFAMLVNNLTNDSNLGLVNSATKKAEILGLTIKIYNCNNDPQIQLSQIEKMVHEGIGGILLVAQDPTFLVEGIELAQQANIPVVAVTNKIESEAITSFVGAPNVLAGELAMGFVAGLLDGKGQIVILEGAAGQSVHMERRNGIQNILDKHSSIRVLTAKNANWSTSTAMTLMEKWLQAFDSIDAVIAENDDMALGAQQIIEQTGRTIPVVGIDGTSQGLKAVQQGKLAATVFLNGPMQAEIAIDVLFSASQQQTVQTEYWTDCVLVNEQNVSAYFA